MTTVEDIQVLISTKIMREQKISRELEALIEVENEIMDLKGE